MVCDSSVKVPKPPTCKDSRRQSSIFSTFELRRSSSLSDTQLILFNLSEEEDEPDIMDAQQQQFEQDNREQLEELTKQWDKFKPHSLKYVQGTEESIVAPPTTTTAKEDPTFFTSTAEQEEREYDTFIRQNFQKFSGKEGEDATTWLTDLVERFDKLKILESQWISYLPSVLSSKARVSYGKQKSSFTDFDDFSSKLSTDFDLKRDGPSYFRPSAPSSTTSTDRPTATNSLHFSLLKTLNEQVVKKLKTFSDRNQNVVTWLDELEIQFSAHGWGEEVRLKCVPTVLQDHVLKWYTRAATTINSWQDFVTQIKDEFNSKFSQRVAFEQMINYQ
ncbi:unnamed protein product [Didymodactylos carnosus]|uniref:Retrotransposon gag domain-containing protein n=1 Tax=Didymodactylos carnosus TaxID=1234261 RepID=A0A814NKY6_9BILA|nr:unnamed protein product [Didymodactylos carnosus]CAF1093689.1 unnamed protein product [Didymodactylos carnosus]CAF3757497.1 unnamed protein product [Didymodactylos carnosus]CAF3859055.1 unnamed protein product [Didymodactylos carnosus]